MQKTSVENILSMAGITGESAKSMMLVHVDGLTMYAAAKALGINRSTVSVASKRFNRTVELHNATKWPLEMQK